MGNMMPQICNYFLDKIRTKQEKNPAERRAQGFADLPGFEFEPVTQ